MTIMTWPRIDWFCSNLARWWNIGPQRLPSG